MPMTFTAAKTRSGVEYLRVVARGRVTVEEVLALDQVPFEGHLVLGVVDRNADFLAEVHQISRAMCTDDQSRAAIVITNAPLRAMLAFTARFAHRSKVRFFNSEEVALAWLSESTVRMTQEAA
jgi:hypothetical protein